MNHHYDLNKAYQAEGKALQDMLAQSRKHNENNGNKDTPLPSDIEREMSYYIFKITNDSSNPRPRNGKSSSLNQHLCSLCRRIFDDNGEIGPILCSSEAGPYYIHWDIYGLELSSLSGCNLCCTIHRGLMPEQVALLREHSLPSRYDVGEYMIQKGLYALKFFFSYIGRANEKSRMVTLKPIVITLEKTSDIQIPKESVSSLSYTSSVESMNQISKWIDECGISHSCSKFQSASNTSFLPTRLIEIGENIRLRESKDIRAEDPTKKHEYCTLSHCWGTSEFLNLTELRLQEFKTLIPLHKLGKTFQDAISVTKAMGIKYLWIDALCIIQNSVSDWKSEAMLMWEVYTNSYLNISATASSCPSEGLFRPKTRNNIASCVIEVNECHSVMSPARYRFYDDSEWQNYIDKAPVNSRAWVVQERLLAPRIIHFSEHQLFWECHKCQASEEYPDGVPSRYQLETGKRRIRLAPTQDLYQQFLDIWDMVVRIYTDGNLSHTSDKLIAVSALAQQTAYITNLNEKEYLAGLWKTDLIYQLLWTPSDGATRAINEYRAPTWSWASMNGSIRPNMSWGKVGHSGHEQELRPMSKVIDASTETQGFAFGPIDGGLLLLCAPSLKGRLLLMPEKKETFDQSGSEISRITFTHDEEYGALYTDDREWNQLPSRPMKSEVQFEWPLEGGTHVGSGRLDIKATQAEITEVYFVPLMAFHEVGRVVHSTLSIASVRGLVLEKIRDNRNVFRRIGTCRFDGNAVIEFLCYLGDQEILNSLEVLPDKLLVEDFSFDGWSGLTLDFLPRQYPQYMMKII